MFTALIHLLIPILFPFDIHIFVYLPREQAVCRSACMYPTAWFA